MKHNNHSWKRIGTKYNEGEQRKVVLAIVDACWFGSTWMHIYTYTWVVCRKGKQLNTRNQMSHIAYDIYVKYPKKFSTLSSIQHIYRLKYVDVLLVGAHPSACWTCKCYKCNFIRNVKRLQTFFFHSLLSFGVFLNSFFVWWWMVNVTFAVSLTLPLNLAKVFAK